MNTKAEMDRLVEAMKNEVGCEMEGIDKL